MEKWNISDPVLEFTASSFIFEYIVSDYIDNGMISEAVYDENCIDGDLVDQSTLVSKVTFDDFVRGNGDTKRKIVVEVSFDPNTISNKPEVYSETNIGGQIGGKITFCHRFMLSTLATEMMPDPIEVNFLETITTLNIDLTDGFDIGTIQVAPKDRLVQTSFSKYEVDACFCDGTQCTIGGFGGRQGDFVQVCVKPESAALANGFFMRRIDEFTWRRDFGGVIGEVTQEAVVGGKAASNLLSDVFCESGSSVCSFLSILKADFFLASGIVSGDGFATLQFGTQPLDDPLSDSFGRRLDDRYLQDDGESRAAIELSMEARPRANPYDRSAAPVRPTTVMFGAAILLAGVFDLL